MRWAAARYVVRTPGLLGERSLRITPEGLWLWSAAMGESRCAWTAVHDLRATPDHLFIYFSEENGQVVERFLGTEAGFREVGSPWAEAHLPPAARAGKRLQLDPVRTGTDAFFVAILERGG